MFPRHRCCSQPVVRIDVVADTRLPWSPVSTGQGQVRVISRLCCAVKIRERARETAARRRTLRFVHWRLRESGCRTRSLRGLRFRRMLLG